MDKVFDLGDLCLVIALAYAAHQHPLFKGVTVFTHFCYISGSKGFNSEKECFFSFIGTSKPSESS